MKCVACGNENDSRNSFCIFCGKNLLQEPQKVKGAETESDDTAEVENKEVKLDNEIDSKEANKMAVVDRDNCEIQVQNNQVDVVQPQGEVYIETSLVKKKSGFKLVAGMLILVILGVGVGTGLFYYMKRAEAASNKYEENYDLNTVYGMEYTNGEDLEFANLYYQTIGKEKISIAENINRYSFKVSPKSGNMAYVDGDNNLFVGKAGSTPIKVSKEVGEYTTSFSEDGAYLFFGTEPSDGSEGARYIYNIAKDTKEKLFMGSYIQTYFDEESKLFYYVDEDSNLYRVKDTSTKDKLAENVSEFGILDKSTYMCQIYEDNQYKYVIYTESKDKIEEQELAFDYVEGEVGTLKNGKAFFFTGIKRGSYDKALYMLLKGQEPVQLVASCERYEYSEDHQIIYYIDSNGELYSLEIPELNKKCFTDKGYLKRVVETIKPQKLMNEVIGFQISPDGKNVLAYKDDTLYLCRNKEQVKLISSNQQFIDIFNDYVIYLTNENELFIQEGIDTTDISNLKEPQLIGELVESYTTSKYGKYITYVNQEENQNKLMLYSKEEGKVVLLEDADAFDYITFNGLERERKLKYEELIGHYSCEVLDGLFEFSEDGRITAYALGEEQASTLLSLSSYSRDGIYVESLEPGDLEMAINSYDPYETTTVLGAGTIISVTQDGTCLIYGSGDYTYELTPITEDVFNQKFEEQQEKERIRIEEEEARLREEEERRRKEEELTTRAQNYYHEGAYIMSNTYIYDSYNYSSSSGYYTIGDRMWSVYDYYIDYNTSTIWVKIVYTPGSSYYTKYGWIPLS